MGKNIFPILCSRGGGVGWIGAAAAFSHTKKAYLVCQGGFDQAHQATEAQTQRGTNMCVPSA